MKDSYTAASSRRTTAAMQYQYQRAFEQSSKQGATRRDQCEDTSPEALMFPTTGRKGEKVPRQAKNFLKWRIHPIAAKLGIPRKLITFQVMRRTLGTDL
jgi:hypothetical protein